ncbi:hypothetical protein I4U23_005846 [Adineta vaga]|nr:hypothetical protein I4U23_005846 [Adineta vaga]
MRFIAFILSCVCANRYSPIGLGYSILAGFTLVPALILLLVEYLHYYRLWFYYRPDRPAKEKVKYDDHHLRFLPLSITNDQQTSYWQSSRCSHGENCSSRDLYHVIMYHSGNTKYSPEKTQDGQIVIGFHQTSHKFASMIAKNNFEPSPKGWIGPGVYFATSLNHTEFKANQFGAYICARVDLGKTKRITDPTLWKTVEGYDTIYYEHPFGADEFCVKSKRQILSWIIVVNQDPNLELLKQKNNDPLPSGNYVEDYVEDRVYRGCLFQV